MEQNQPNFAIRLMVVKDGNILLGKNKGLYGTGKYGFPGGHIEYMESFKKCINRELSEECGIEVQNIRFLCVYNIRDDKPFHNVNLTLICDWKSGEPKVLEPEKCESWNWHALDNLPQPLFKNVELSIQSYKTGKNYFDADEEFIDN